MEHELSVSVEDYARLITEPGATVVNGALTEGDIITCHVVVCEKTVKGGIDSFLKRYES